MNPAVVRRLWPGLCAPLLSLALLAGCATAPTPAPATPPTEPVTVRLIAFNDLHGHLEGTGLTLPWPDPADKTQVQRLSAGARRIWPGWCRACARGPGTT